MKIAIYCRSYDERSIQVVRDLLRILRGKGVDVLLYHEMYARMPVLPGKDDRLPGIFGQHDRPLPPDVDFLVSVGGDGTFLNSIEYIRDSGIPVVGINIGRLGFMAHLNELGLQESVEKLLSGVFPIEERSLLQIEMNNHPFGNFPYALNDVVIHKSAHGLMTIHTWGDDEFLNSYWADGLIVATPTGSSAYSLSAGGPVVAPESHNFIISPIAAHNLNVRPLIIPDSVVLTLKTECRDGHFTVSLDSRSAGCDCNTEILLKRAGFNIRVVQAASFYTTLRNKLMWGADRRN